VPKSALPEGFKDQADGTNTDWNNWFQKYWRRSWFAYGPRATEWWAKWREWPITVFAIRGKGTFRFEDDVRDFSFGYSLRTLRWWAHKDEYLSAIQYWSKWGFQLQWPFFIAFHYYLDDVPQEPEKGGARRVFYFRFGARRDADKVYWSPSFFIGLTWN